MHAVILVFDENDSEIITVRPDWLIFVDIGMKLIDVLLPKKLAEKICLNLPKWCYPRDKKAVCPCVKAGSMRRAKKLLKYLRRKLKLKNNQISILRTSLFLNSEHISDFLERLIEEHKNEDILFFYGGHGWRKYWHLGDGNNGYKILHFHKLRKIFGKLRKNLILIAGSCHALAIEPYLYELRGRYLLFGDCRSENSAQSTNSVLNKVIESWERREPAYPVVGSVKRHKINKKEMADFPTGRSLVMKESEASLKICVLHGLNHNPNNCISGNCSCAFSKRTSIKKKPSLRRGAPLDHLCYPV